MILSIVKDLFKSFECLRRSVLVLLGSERELIDDVAGLRKKHLTRCQNSIAKIILVRFHKK